MLPRALVKNPISISKHRGFNHNKSSVKIHSGSRGCTGSQPYSDSLFEQSKLVVTADVFSSLLKTATVNTLFWELPVWSGVIWGRSGVILEWRFCRIVVCDQTFCQICRRLNGSFVSNGCKMFWALKAFCTSLIGTLGIPYILFDEHTHCSLVAKSLSLCGSAIIDDWCQRDEAILFLEYWSA